MSKADEMFEKLEFKKILDDDIEVVYKFDKRLMGDRCIQHIMFSRVSKIIFSYGIDVEQNCGIGLKELQAINEKCKELGWLDE